MDDASVANSLMCIVLNILPPRDVGGTILVQSLCEVRSLLLIYPHILTCSNAWVHEAKQLRTASLV